MEVLNAALNSVEPYGAVLRALSEEQQKTPFTLYTNIYVVGAGKAGARMARAAEDALGDRIAGGLVVVKEGYADTGGAPLQRIELVEAGHPVPDERGVEAASRILQIADSAGENDLVLCLISGGGSALLVSPVEGVSLTDIQTATQLLLNSGATINALNAVRKHLSQVAGGQLARRAFPAGVLSLILSDVIGSPLDVIASGPTAPDPTTYADALGVIEKYELAEQMPASVMTRLRSGASGQLAETCKPGDAVFERVGNLVIASNETATEAAASRAREMGLDTLIVSNYLEGEASEMGIVLANIANGIAQHGRPVAPPACLIFGGETTVTVRGTGQGGRNSELALSAAIALDSLGPDIVIASFATDGGDGNSPGAGAIIDGTTLDRSKERGLDTHAALANNDSYTLLASLGDAIITGPTGTNVNDLMAIFAF